MKVKTAIFLITIICEKHFFCLHFQRCPLYASFCITNMRCSIGGIGSNGGITVGKSGLGVIGKSVVDFIKHLMIVIYGLSKITCTIPPPPT
jgi:hypothetical protein